jgi:hypothetical protein
MIEAADFDAEDLVAVCNYRFVVRHALDSL